MWFTALLACVGAPAPSLLPARDTAPNGALDSARDTSPEVLPPDTAARDSARDTAPAEDTGATPPGPLPVLIVDTEAPPADTTKVGGVLRVIEEHDGTLTDLDGAPTAYLTAIGIEIHGSSSTGYPKRGYKFECRDGAGEDDDCPLVGLPEGSDWVLHAPYADKTYLRNALAYALGREVAGTARWEPRARFVELVLNGSYEGLYLLVERVSREDDRLDIPPTTLDDGTVGGGFVVKVDQHRSAGFDTARGTPIDWSTPKAGAVTAAEAAYIAGWFDAMEAALAADTWADPVVGYPAWLDTDAWVDHWLLNELTHNIDAYRLSAYLWVDGPPGVGRLRAGPLWDFDRAWGNCNYCDTWSTEGWVQDSLTTCGYGYQFPSWWARLREDPAFDVALRERWAALRAGPLADDALRGRIAAMRATLAAAEARDHARWPVVGTWVDPNYHVGATWDEDVAWFEAWALARAAWMDAHVGE